MNFRVQINTIDEGQLVTELSFNTIEELFNSIFSSQYVIINNIAYAVSRITSVKAIQQ